MNETNDCPICKVIRTYLILAVPMVLILFIQPEEPIFGAYSLLKIAPWAIGISLVCVIAWKYYHEFVKKK